MERTDDKQRTQKQYIIGLTALLPKWTRVRPPFAHRHDFGAQRTAYAEATTTTVVGIVSPNGDQEGFC